MIVLVGEAREFRFLHCQGGQRFLGEVAAADEPLVVPKMSALLAPRSLKSRDVHDTARQRSASPHKLK